MKKFIKQVLLFLIPYYFLGAFAVYFIGVGYYTHELSGIDSAIVSQRKSPDALLGLSYNEQNHYYKLVNTNYYKADIIALGTSRVMQIREEYFTTNFYNAGGGVEANFDEYENFLMNLDYTPEMILLGIDLWVFNDNWNKKVKNYNEFTEITVNDRDVVSITKELYKDWKLHKWNHSMLGSYPGNIGLTALVRQNGFKNDGSYYYGDIYRNPSKQADWQFRNTIDRIDKGVNRFEYGDAIDSETVDKLDHFLAYCKEHDIIIVGFTAPLAPSVYDYMDQSGKYNYMYGIHEACRSVFDKYHYLFFDFLDGEVLGLDDGFYVDGFHGGDVVYAEIVRRLAVNSDFLGNYIDLAEMDHLLKERKNNLSIKAIKGDDG